MLGPGFPASGRLAASARLIHAILACHEEEDEPEASAAENQKIPILFLCDWAQSCQFAIGYVSSRGNRVIRGCQKVRTGETGVEKGWTRHGTGLLQRAFAGHAVVVWLLSYSARERIIEARGPELWQHVKIEILMAEAECFPRQIDCSHCNHQGALQYR